MKRCLVDVNVWLALLVRQHEHHRVARKWFDTLVTGEAGLCRFVQLGLMRLLANRTVMGDHAVSAAAAWTLIQELLEDERLEFAPEPADLDSILPGLLHYPTPTGKLIADAYLAAFAIASSRRLVTLDQGFRQYRAVEIDLLGR
jgi:toxin-antitoxin system PIN domain toxin